MQKFTFDLKNDAKNEMLCISTCKGKEVIPLRTKVSTGVSFCELCRQTRVALSCGWLHRYPPCIYLCMSHYAHQRGSVSKHDVYVWVMV